MQYPAKTARRAIHILVDLGIVSSKKGMGITIQSAQKALKYVEQNQSISTLIDLKKEMALSVARQKKELDFFNEKMVELVERTENLRSENPFIPYQLVLEENAQQLDKSIGELPLWEYTQATIVAIRRGENLIISPGPYESLKVDDTIFYFGKVDTPPKVKTVLLWRMTKNTDLAVCVFVFIQSKNSLYPGCLQSIALQHQLDPYHH